MDRGAWQATVHGVTKRQTRLKRLSGSSDPAEMLWNVYCISEFASKCNKELLILLSSIIGWGCPWVGYILGHFLVSLQFSKKGYKDQSLKEKHIGALLVGPVVKDSRLPLQQAWVPSLVGELRSHMPQEKKKIKTNPKTTQKLMRGFMLQNCISPNGVFPIP